MAAVNSTSEVQQFNPEALQECIQKALAVAVYMAESHEEFASFAAECIVDNLTLARENLRLLGRVPA
ncbi:MAG: hypothetical protein NFW16_21000 [Candidatus Accumulibacter sp.]|uniref:hypothetical protein n=1 Tax=Accumulibacter sp. TaxID=2053492 RepID=UPI002586BF97|nr:hypothetical protein [Accumulibacter sp.]MCM8624144.1 hypothetical protein [Accumulibacter sp.]